MTAVDTFNALWVLMALPGFALLRRARHAWLDQGAFAALSTSYLVTFALLTPVGIFGYWFGWPIQVLSTAMLALIALAIVDLAWHWRELALLPRPSLLGVIVLLMVMADYFAARRVGTHLSGDAQFHAGKIRMLMDYGFVNWDPYTPGHRFDVVYHSNLYHAAIAAWARLTELASFDAWSRMLPWAKLLAAGSAEGLAFALFRSRSLALAAAGAAVIAWYPLTIMPYPNQLAGLWLLPFALARGIDLLAGDEPKRAACGIAVAALVLAQLHGLYYAFECVLLGPVLLGALLCALARRRTRRSALAPALGLIALSVGLPWLAMSALQRGLPSLSAPATSPATQPAAQAASDADPEDALEQEPAEDARTDNWRYKGFLLFRDGQLALDPGQLADPNNMRVHLLLALSLLLLALRQPRRIQVLAGMAATMLLLLHVPALCTLAVRAAGSPWIVRRLDVITVLLALAVVPGALGMLLLDRAWLRGPIPHLMFGLALAYAWTFETGDAHARERYLNRVENPDKQEMELRKQARRAWLLKEMVPRGAVIATSLARAVEIAKVCDCYPLALAADQGSHGLEDMAARRSALYGILDPETDNATRARYLQRYAVRHIFMGNTRASKALRRKVEPMTVDVHRSRIGLLIELDPARALAP